MCLWGRLASCKVEQRNRGRLPSMAAAPGPVPKFLSVFHFPKCARKWAIQTTASKAQN